MLNEGRGREVSAHTVLREIIIIEMHSGAAKLWA